MNLDNNKIKITISMEIKKGKGVGTHFEIESETGSFQAEPVFGAAAVSLFVQVSKKMGRDAAVTLFSNLALKGIDQLILDEQPKKKDKKTKPLSAKEKKLIKKLIQDEHDV